MIRKKRKLKKGLGWKLFNLCISGCNHLIDYMIYLFLIIVLLYCGLNLWDTYSIYNNADVSEEILAFKPSENTNSLDELKALYPNVIAWLTIDDTYIDYPVVQGEDNEYYINHAVDDSYQMSGAIFLDFTNSPDFSDAYSLIYGHHMAANKMFGQITDYREKDFYENHRRGELYFNDETYELNIFAVVSTDAYDTNIFIPSMIQDPVTLRDYVKTKSLYYDDIEINSEDHIIGLSTCDNTDVNGRLILICKIEKALSN